MKNIIKTIILINLICFGLKCTVTLKNCSRFQSSNTNGVAELTCQPTIDVDSIVASEDSAVKINLPLDAETKIVQVSLKNHGDTSARTVIQVVTDVKSQDYPIEVKIPANTFVIGEFVYVEVVVAKSISANYNKYGLITLPDTGTTYEVLVVTDGKKSIPLDTGISVSTLTIK